VDRRLPAFFGLFSDLDTKINQRRIRPPPPPIGQALPAFPSSWRQFVGHADRKPSLTRLGTGECNVRIGSGFGAEV
jgi:hypothetical protein